MRPAAPFLPEVDAYARVLSAHGHTVKISSAEDPVPDTSQVDLVYRFGGFLARRASPVPEIHEYSSASTGRLPRLKNFIKSVGSCRPAGRVFTEPFVRDQFKFVRSTPFMWRDVGIDPRLLQARSNTTKSFDLVYVGSIESRPKVANTLVSLARKGFRVLAAGSGSPDIAHFLSREGVTFVGRISPNEVPELLSQATHGLNIMPTKYPLQFQTSSKVLEYLGAGLTIVSNAYPWIEQHSRSLGYEFVRLETLFDKEIPVIPTHECLDLGTCHGLTWDSILKRQDFVGFLESSLLGRTVRDSS